MNITEARTVIALLRHLDGSHTFDETDLVTSLLTLAERANKALAEQSWDVTLDEDALLDTLAQVAQRFADTGDYDDEEDGYTPYEPDEPAKRPIVDAPVSGDRL